MSRRRARSLTPRHPNAVLGLLTVLVCLLAGRAHAADAKPAAKKPEPVTLDAKSFEKLFKGLEWRAIGPANMGGRISDFAVVESNPAQYYVGTATGGVFKTNNQGTTWQAVFEKEAVASTGAIAVFQKKPELVWLGTGEPNGRNSSAWGDGVYRSDDGGGSWTNVGLKQSASIGRIVCDPNDSLTVYVAALGKLWGANPERGVYKTHDGGRSWSQVLKVDANTGCVDLAMDPAHPNRLYAAMYARRRSPWSFTGVSETGGVFRTGDGGKSWTKCTDGLPKRTGRIGLAVYAKNPDVVYAVVESDEGGRLSDFEETSRTGGVFRSDDAGVHWKRISPFSPRSFYFSQIRVQPDDSTRIYLLGTDLYVSDDAGATFRARGAKAVHPDCHAMWIDPKNGKHLLLGCDGGVNESADRASTWRFVNNLPIGEFYDVATNMREPYYDIYGGLQDNQSWGGPSRTRFEIDNWLDDSRDGHGIMNEHWFVLGGGDGFHVAADPTNPDIVYYESQGGEMLRQDLSSGRERACKPSQNEGEQVFRFNWNTPFLLSPHDPTVLWMGGQYVFRLYERGDKWERVSPDLTTNDPNKMATGGSGAEQHCTIVALSESPAKAGVLWAGTDDGKVWVTPDAGKTWHDLTANVKGVPRGLYVSCIDASPLDPGTAWLSFDGHRSDDVSPYVFVTHDQGKSWTSLAAGLRKDAPVVSVRGGRTNKDLVYVGTEFGMSVSLEGGRNWLPLKNGLPTVAVDDIHTQPRDLDLVVGTHGRSLYVLDGVQVFEEWSARALQDSLTFFTPKPAWAWHKRSLGGKFGSGEFSAKNPPYGAWFDYFLPREIEGGVAVAIADSAGKSVRSLTGPGEAGFHRVVWDLAAGDPKLRIRRTELSGQPALVRPGRYKVTLTAGRGAPRVRTLEVKAVPGTYLSEL
jgi:photosystem II stability/assembly factor-like uncharacterized protein